MTQPAAPIPPRKRFFNVLEIENELGAYDELPLILPHIDPQVTGSRNALRQPFFLICEKDTVLAAVTGDAWIEFRDCDVRRHRFGAGDFVYVPGGTPHRIAPSTPGLHVRYQARAAGQHGVAWFCERCDAVLHRIEWDTSAVLAQEAFARACRYYAEAIAGTPCSACAAAAPALDLTGTRWDELAVALANEAPAVDPLAKH